VVGAVITEISEMTVTPQHPNKQYAIKNCDLQLLDLNTRTYSVQEILEEQ